MRRAALVTGASDGIGRAVAQELAGAGWDVAVHYNRNRAGADLTARGVAEAGGRAVILQADLSVPVGAMRLMSEYGAAFGRMDALVNNAGIVDRAARVEEMTAERLTRMFAVNLTAPFLLAGHAARRMSTRHGGSGGVIVNVSSIAARLGSGGQYVDYAASKAGLDALTKGLADEVAAEGVRVVSVRPGLVDTAIHGKGGEPDRAIRLADRIPMRRAGTAREIARTILWLLSGDASYITGTTIDVSGGR
ncbi:MAG: SDR family oxidoreductase [Rhodobacteraceae bacterium]|mgnify:CR=1 FL=1|jgi:glucose 1-dehydrogenase|nr:SDR family oxidoreductase [uncultured Defluviimonas sp.]MCB2124174.1 SDR family oxidoreductase [Paracoccaceae bacterium]MCC0070100.1 SDR family oxidoreductase [Paracoccaceae bacterium]